MFDEIGFWIGIIFILYVIGKALQNAKDTAAKVAKNERAKNIGLSLLERLLK